MTIQQQTTIQHTFIAFSHLVTRGETVSAPELAARIEGQYDHNNGSLAEVIATLYTEEKLTFTRPIH